MRGLRREGGMAIALVLLCAGLDWSNPDFLSSANLINLLRQFAMLAIFALGSGFVIISGGIDLSVGSMIGLTGVLVAKFSSEAVGGLGYPIWVGIGAAFCIALLLGWCQGWLITRLKLQPFIVTLAGMLLLRGLSQTVVEGGSISFGNHPFLALGRGGVLNVHGEPMVPYPFLILLGVALVATYLLHGTVYGRYLYAIGGNREAALYSGVPVRRVETSVYVFSAGLAAIAGVCYAAYVGQMSQQVGIAYELYAIAAAVLGGCALRGGEGSVIGVLIGAAIMRVIDNGINLFQWIYTDADGHARLWRLDPNWTYIIVGAVILLAVVVDQLAHALEERRALRQAAAGART